MNAKLKKLPIGIQNFEALITGDYLYVDKTRHLYKMATEGMFYFLSRPRRFGKSLMVSTLQAMFEGKRELFQDLWIARESDWEWAPHPVLRIDFSEISFNTPEVLRQGLLDYLRLQGKLLGVSAASTSLRSCFAELLLGLFEKHRSKVAVLIDEYDQPLINHLGKGEAGLEIAKNNREVLREFYGVLKGGNVNEALKFVLLTGISKFGRVNIFSELNNLSDLTMHPAYPELLGYTQDELETVFADHIKSLSENTNAPRQAVLAKLKAWYNGYRFTIKDVQVYNPFSVLNVLQRETFENYWFETATPAFLVNVIKEKDYPVPGLETLELQQQDFAIYDLDHLKLEPLLFQTGYITIKGHAEELFQLGYPNQEVKTSWLNYLYDRLVEIPDSSLKVQYKKLHLYLRQEQLELFVETANAILSAIPYPHAAGQDERYYHTVLYLMLSASGVLVPTEVLTVRGRVDMEVYFPEKIYVVELKCNQSAEQALAQIKAKKYFEKHVQSGKKILLLGVNFSTQERRISDWRVETVAF